MISQVSENYFQGLDDFGTDMAEGIGCIPLDYRSAVWDNPLDLIGNNSQAIAVNPFQIQKSILVIDRSNIGNVPKYIILQQIPDTIKIYPSLRISCISPAEELENFSLDRCPFTKRTSSLFEYEIPEVLTRSQSTKKTQVEKVKEIISSECLEFCKSQNIIEVLNQCLYQVKQNFISVQKIQAELSCFQDDEEFDNEPHIAIEVRVESSRVVAGSNYDKWLNWFVTIPQFRRKFFILTIDRV